MKSLKSNWWQDTKQLIVYLKDRLILSIVVGIITLVLTIALKNYYWEYAPDLNTAILVSLLMFIFFIAKDAYCIYELRNRLEKAEKVYHDLIDAHIDLPHYYPKFIDERILEEKTQNGLIFINVIDDDYAKWLKKCAENARDSLCATLNYPYLPSTFFEDDNKNLKYFEEINNIAKKISYKKRIYIFKKIDFIKDLKKLDIDNLKIFFKNQSEFKIFFLDKKKFSVNHISDYSNIHIAINSDFALFDSSLAFRRIGSLELAYYFTKGETKTLPCSFRKLFDDDIIGKDCFHELKPLEIINFNTKSKIIDYIKDKIKYDENTTD